MLNESQSKAYDLILKFLEGDEKVISILGGPGTGKSFLIGYMKDCISNLVLTATTNEAARVIGGITIHKYLGFGIKCKREYYSRVKPGDIVLVDEASMLATCIMKELVKIGCKVILVGDPRQLVVGFTTDIEAYPHLLLTQNMRASSTRLIELVEQLHQAVDTEVAVNIKEHIGDHLIFVDCHNRFLELIQRSSDECQVLAYTNTIVDRYQDETGTGLTIHKSQGKSYDEVFIDVRDLISNYTKAKNKFNNPLTKKTYLRLLLVAISRARYRVHLFIGEKRWVS